MKKRFLSILLSVAMVMAFMPAMAFADEADAVTAQPGEETLVEQPTEEPIVEEPAVEPVVEEPTEEPVVEVKPAIIMLTGKISGARAVKLNWTAVEGATEYVVYGNRCGKKAKKLATVTENKCTVKKIKDTKLETEKFYKFYVVALNGETQLGKSKAIHFITGGANDDYANAVSVTVEKASVEMKPAETEQVTPAVEFSVAKKGSPTKHGAEFRYQSSDTEVATVTKEGLITAVKEGTATIYVSHLSGEYCTVNLIVTFSPEREAAKAAVVAAAGEEPSEAVQAIVEEAIAAIDAAGTPEDIEAAKQDGLAKIQAKQLEEAEAAAKKALEEAKAAAKAKVAEAAGEEPSEAVQAIVEETNAAIDATATAEEADAAAEAGIAKIQAKQLEEAEAAAKKALEEAKAAAKAKISALVGKKSSLTLKTLAYRANKAIDAAKTIEEVDAAIQPVLAKIDAQLCKEAKPVAKDEIDKAAGYFPSAAVKKLANNAKKAIDAAKTLAEVEAAKQAGLDEIAAQKQKEEAAATAEQKLAAAKKEAKAEVAKAGGSNTSTAVKLIALSAEKAIDAAKTIDAVNAAKQDGLAKIDAQKLADAKATAKNQVKLFAGIGASSEVEKLVKEANTAIDAAKTADAVVDATKAAIEKIAKQQKKEGQIKAGIATVVGTAVTTAVAAILVNYADYKMLSVDDLTKKFVADVSIRDTNWGDGNGHYAHVDKSLNFGDWGEGTSDSVSLFMRTIPLIDNEEEYEKFWCMTKDGASITFTMKYEEDYVGDIDYLELLSIKYNKEGSDLTGTYMPMG